MTSRTALPALLAALALMGCGVQDHGGGGDAHVSTSSEAVRVIPSLDLADGQTSASVIAIPLAEAGQYSISYEFTRTDVTDAVTLTLLDDTATQTLGSVTISALPAGATPNPNPRCNLGAACLFATHQANLTANLPGGISAGVKVKASISPGGLGHVIHVETIRAEPTRLTTFVDPNAAGFESATQFCSDCHGEQYRQWRSSMMGYSSISPPIHALELTENHVDRPSIQDSTPPMPLGRFNRLGPVTGDVPSTLFSAHAESGLFCQRCHSPVGVFADVNRVFAKFDFSQARGSFPDSHGLLRQLGGYDAINPSLLRSSSDFNNDGVIAGDVDSDGVPGTFFDEFPDPASAPRQLLQKQVAVAVEGVTCTVCHGVNGIDTSGPLQPANLDPTVPPAMRSARPQFAAGIANNAFRVMHNDEPGNGRMNLGPYDDFTNGLNPYHPAGKAGGNEQIRTGTDLAARPFIRSGEFCGTCHDVRINFPDEGPNGNFTVNQLHPENGQEPYRRVENLFTEWNASPWNNGGTPASTAMPYKGPFENPGRINDQGVKTATTCQDCHMSQFMTDDAALPGQYDMGVIGGGGTTIRRRSNHRFIGVDRFLTHDVPTQDKPTIPTDTHTDELFPFDISQGTNALQDNSDFPADPKNATRDLREILLQKAFNFRVDHVGPVAGDHLPVRVSVENIGAAHNIPAGLSEERQVWIELEVLDANQNNVFTSGYLNLLEDRGTEKAHAFNPFGPQRFSESYCANPANTPFCDLDQFRVELGPYLNIVSGTLVPGMDTQLANYENGFTLNGNKVFTQFIADHVDDTPALRPFQKRVKQYDVNVGPRTGPFQINAHLRFRPLPFEFLNGLHKALPSGRVTETVDPATNPHGSVMENNIVIEVKQDSCVSGAYGLLGARSCSRNNRVPLALGENTTCSVFDATSGPQSGSVQCFGANPNGEAGIGGYPANAVPLPSVLHLLDVTAVSLGDAHGCALLNDGTVYCWGDGTGGKLADDNALAHTTRAPHQVDLNKLSGISQIDAGGTTTCALTEETQPGNQQVKCWGQSLHGELGDGNPNSHSVASPYTLGSLQQPVSLAAGEHHNCVIASNGGVPGKVLCWGQALGAGAADGGNPNAAVLNPTVIPLNYRTNKLAAGDNFSCALTASSEVYCWGDNQYGTLGNNTLVNSNTPVKVQFADGQIVPDTTDSRYYPHPIDIAAGRHHVCALMSDKRVECWGLGNNGRLGDAATGSHVALKPLAPVLAADTGTDLTDVAFIAAGGSHTCAVQTDGTRRCWGLNESGQLGIGSTSDTASAVPVAFADPGVTGRKYYATLAQGGFGEPNCTSLPNTGVSCSDVTTYVDLNPNTGYKFTIQSDGGPTKLYPSIGVNTGTRSMNLYVDGNQVATVTSTQSATPRPTPPTLPAEVAPIMINDLTPGYHTVEWRDTANSDEFDAVYLRVVSTASASHCHNLVKDVGLEVDADCGLDPSAPPGTPACGKCTNGQSCFVSSDCQSGTCDPTKHICVGPPSCTDMIKNQDETDVDCGGSICGGCGVGKTCNVNGNCLSNSCQGGVCVAGGSPCAGFCSNPQSINWNSGTTYQSGNLGTGVVCRETNAFVRGGNCGNFTGGRQLSVNGQAEPCNNQPWPSMPPPVNGGYCVRTTAGNFDYAYVTLWQ
ncbi:MAG: hypothetical protein ABI488_26705 [Polyangiaceae bacterium]